MNDLILKANGNEGVYLIPGLQGLLAPYWRADVKGGFVGLSGKTGREHLVRAVVESICYRTKDVKFYYFNKFYIINRLLMLWKKKQT
jgi:glycerol kinase